MGARLASPQPPYQVDETVHSPWLKNSACEQNFIKQYAICRRSACLIDWLSEVLTDRPTDRPTARLLASLAGPPSVTQAADGPRDATDRKFASRRPFLLAFAFAGTYTHTVSEGVEADQAVSQSVSQRKSKSKPTQHDRRATCHNSELINLKMQKMNICRTDCTCGLGGWEARSEAAS